MKSAKSSMQRVVVIKQKGGSALVEYSVGGVAARKFVPTVEILGDKVSQSVLDSGIPYGFPWEELSLQFDMEKFSVEMHKVGLWTPQDVLASPQKVFSALRATLADNLSEILQVAQGERKRS